MARSIYADISNEVLDWVVFQVENNPYGKECLTLLKSWRAGEKRPTFSQIKTVSKKTHIPFGYFMFQKPPKEDLSILEYRTIDSLDVDINSRDLIDVKYSLERIQNWYRDLRINEGYSPLDFVGVIEPTGNKEEIANYARTLLGLKLTWFEKMPTSRKSFDFLRAKLEYIGVLVIVAGKVNENTRRKINVSQFRAMALIDNYVPIIFINSNDTDSGRLFSLLHEFIHVLVGKHNLYNLPPAYNYKEHDEPVSKLEVFCNAVAAEILVPDELFLTKWQTETVSDIKEKVSSLAQYFKCSRNVIARKAFDTKKINRQDYENVTDYILQEYLKFGKTKKKSGGGNYYNTKIYQYSKRFLTDLYNSVQAGETLYTEAFELSGTKNGTFQKLMEKVGIAFE